MSLIGSLSDSKIADVLRLFAQGKKTGRLMVTDEEAQVVLRFQRGNIVHAQASDGRLAGDEVILDLFGWKAGQLTFIPDEKSVTPNVQRGVDQIILDGVRLGDSFHRMNELIPSDRVFFQMAATPADGEVTLAGRELRVLRLADGSRDVRELVEVSKLPRPELLRALFELHERKVLERVEPVKSLRIQPQGLFGKDTAEMDLRLEEEWKRVQRYSPGVLRIEARSDAGKAVTLAAVFKPGLLRDVHLPRAAISELGLREGDDVLVRPIA